MTDRTSDFSLSEHEVIVRSYECTRLRKKFSPVTIGYLTITNNRVIYHSTGKSMQGESCLIADVPIDDVGGIKMEISNSINWPSLVLYLAIAFFGVGLLADLLPQFFTDWPLAIIMCLPLLFLILVKKNVLNQEIKENLLSNPTVKFLQESGKDSLAEEIIRALGLVGMTILVWIFVNRTGMKENIPFMGTLALIAGYLLVYRIFFGLRNYFSLQIFTKSASGKGIFIPGNTFFSLFGDKTAAETLNANPAKDTQVVVRELGAIITDIRQSGDMGVQKWSKSQPV